MQDAMARMVEAMTAHMARRPAGGDGVAQMLRHARDCAEQAIAAAPAPGAVEGDGSAANPAARRFLEPALEAARSGPASGLVDAIDRIRGELRWVYGYPARPGEEDLPQRVAFSQVVGPDVRLRHGATRLGFTLIGPGTLYPAHAHPAVELYFVLAGTARWATRSTDADQPPGAFILHPSGEPHLMQTGDAPLLAFYVWQGDIHSPSRYVDL